MILFACVRSRLSLAREETVQQLKCQRRHGEEIEGEGPDSRKHFLCRQPTCVENRDPNHVPENFGTLVFAK